MPRLRCVRGFKVTNVKRSRLVGIACETLQQLKSKGCEKLQISKTSKHIDVCLTDGTIVDDEQFFKHIPNQTILILRQPGERIVEDVDIIYKALKSFNVDLLRTAAEHVRPFLDQDTQEKIKILAQFVKDEEHSKKAALSRKLDHPEWFEDLETYAETKEDFMRKRSRGRIQKYLYNTREAIKNSPLYCNETKKNLDTVFSEFHAKLKRDDFFGGYFDRSDNTGKSMCDKIGEFPCQGLWNKENCSYLGNELGNLQHKINPYASRENRVIFSMWNLDHRIERSRRVIPALMHAAQICCQKGKKSYRVNSLYFYELLFTTKNLKLVHIVCHDKNEHRSAICDRKRYVNEVL
ncbi:DNA fragmentation factor subunit beta isoform X2 [Planococcus citri]|uniref:DNA fragmentation factor subunit beta isoform X2 n=1 Tax=Planococcus citri TaxID=170843 RepID=UPI0031F8A6E6